MDTKIGKFAENVKKTIQNGGLDKYMPIVESLMGEIIQAQILPPLL